MRFAHILPWSGHLLPGCTPGHAAASLHPGSSIGHVAGEVRRRVEFWLTDDARDGLDSLATRHHVTKVAFMEALGLLGRRGDPTVDEVVELARRIDSERRSRR